MSEFMEYVWMILPSLLRGVVVTVELFVLTLVLALPLGLPLALGSRCRIAPVRWICQAYIWVFRGTPLILQLFAFYFFLPIFFKGLGINLMLDSFPTAVITFVLNYAAYFAEIYRGGIASVGRGQFEAAQSLGLSPARTMMGIILPQTFKTVLPPISNETITLVKDTALVSVISVGELLKAANDAVNRDVNATAYAIAAIIYLLFTFLLTLLSRKLEKRYSRHEAKEG